MLRTMEARARLLWYRFGRLREWLGPVRAAWFTLRDRPGGSGEVDLTWPGYAAPFRLRWGGTDVRTFGHVIAAQGYQLPFPVEAAPRWIVDAGANIGLSAVYFASRFPDSTVLAIEPDPGNFRLLQHHAERYPNIVPIRAALWDDDGGVTLSDPGTGPWGYRVDEALGGGLRVDSVTVEGLIDQFEIDEIGILKIDIEGGEATVMRDPAAWIDRVGAIAIELHDHYAPDATKVFEAATIDFTRRTARGEDTFVAR